MTGNPTQEQGGAASSRWLRPSINWLLVFAPVAVVLDQTGHANPGPVFLCAAVAIVPFARLIVQGTEHVAAHAGATLGGLLNATFGNLPELIIAMAALRAGLLEIVRASIIGALLANLLFALGLSFLLGGMRHRKQEFNPRAVAAFSSTMVLAWLSLAMPSAFHRALAAEVAEKQYVALDLIVAALLLSLYGLFLLYSLRTHPETFAELGAPSIARPSGHSGLGRGIAMLLIASGGAAWMSELLVGVAEPAGRSLGMSPMFIGVIVLAIIGGAAETGSAVAMARANRIDLSVGIALGSCVQIALFVAPVLVLVAPAIGPVQFQLVFSQAEMWMLFGAVLLGSAVTTSGHADWFKGAQLLALYLMIAVVLYLLPGEIASGH